MLIKFKCPKCKTELEAGDQFAGSKATCPKCREVISVPGSQPKSPGSKNERGKNK